MNRIAIALTAASALALSACAKKAPESLPPDPVDTSTPTPTVTPTPSGPIEGSGAHFRQVMAGQDTIYFDTDKFDIDSQDAAALRSQAQYMLQYTQSRATIEGHADERGTPVDDQLRQRAPGGDRLERIRLGPEPPRGDGGAQLTKGLAAAALSGSAKQP